MWGRGAKDSSQTHLGFLPVPHTDFIFSSFAEEHGFVGIVIALVLYFLMIMQVVQNAQTATDRAGLYVCMGYQDRTWWKLGATIVGLTLSLALAGSAALLLLSFAARIEAAPIRALEWSTVVVLLMFSFAVVYRFAPNLRDHNWSWSTPGAVCALLLWVGSTVGVRLYVQHINDYTRTYGHLNSVVMLLLWLYLTNRAILIGGEMNSEIEKAAAKSGKKQRSGS